jgi:predicted GNAT family acetyltransferase
MNPDDDEDLQFGNDEDGRRYVAKIGDRIAGLIEYELRPDQIVFLHTETEPAFGGRGIAGRLTRWALDDVRARGLGLVPLCSYTQHFLTEHPEYGDVLA